MYTEEQNNRSRGLFLFLGKFIIIAAFILLILWLYPFPKNQELPNLKTFYDDVFNRNITNMRNAAVNWYTVDKLPTKVDQTYRLTLQDMLDKKLLLNFTDKKGQYCDSLKSYVEVTKQEKDYLFKINLDCPASNQQDYILEYRGCYDLCATCKTEVIKVVKPAGKVIKNTVVIKQVDPNPSVESKTYSCANTIAKYGSTAIKITRKANDPKFDYEIKVKQPNGWIFTTYSKGTMTTNMSVISKTIAATSEGTLEYRVYINGKLHAAGDSIIDKCEPSIVKPKPEVKVEPKTCPVNTDSLGSATFTITRQSDDPQFEYTIKVKQPNGFFYHTVDQGIINTNNDQIIKNVAATAAGDMYYQIIVNGELYKSGIVNINECHAPKPKPVVEVTPKACTVNTNSFGSLTVSIKRDANDPEFNYSIKVKQPTDLFYSTYYSGLVPTNLPLVNHTINGTSTGKLYYEVLINGESYKTGYINIDQCNVPKPVVEAKANSCSVEQSEFGSATISIKKQDSDADFDYIIKVKQPGAWFKDTIATGTLTTNNPSVTKVVFGEAEGNLAYEVLVNGEVYKTGTVVIDKCTAPEVDPEPAVYIGTNSCEALEETYSNLVVSVNKRPEDPSFNYIIKIKQPNEIVYSTVANGALNDAAPFISKTIQGQAQGVIWYQIFINDKLYKSGSEAINKCETTVEYEYLLKRENTTNYWTAWSDWQSTPVTASSTRKVNTLDFYRGYKWIDSLVYEYKHQRYVADGYTEWGEWSSWSRTAQTISDTKDVETRTVEVKTEVGTKTVYGKWTDNPQKVIVDQKYYSIYNTGNSATATEYRQYLGEVSTNNCRNCYAYEIYTRSKSTVTLYDYADVKEYRYRTRQAKTKLETIWSTSKSINGWVYTGYARISENNGYYATTNWLEADAWNALVADGYTLYQKYTYYTYADLKTVTETEYKWHDEDHLTGWTYTGISREKGTE